MERDRGYATQGGLKKKQNQHLTALQDKRLPKKKKIEHMRNYKALEGVVKSLRWDWATF